MKQPRIGLLLIGDLIAIGIAFVATLIFGFGGTVPMETVIIHARPFSLLYTFWLLIFYIFELYDVEYHRHGVQLYTKISQALLTALLASIAFFYIMPFYGITPRTNLAINITVFGVFFLLWRIIFSRHLAKRFILRTTILDPNNRLQGLVTDINANPQLGLGSPSHVKEYSQLREQDHLIVDTHATPGQTIELILNQPHAVIDAITAYERYFQKIPIDLIDTKWVIHNIKKRQAPLYNLIHDIFGRLIAVVILALSSPVTIPTMLIIWLEDRGPIFYTQTRTGQYDRPFPLFKFRSMKLDAEKNGAVWSSGSSDNRVTRIGRIIRKLHIDEIPQMLNILRGDISLIGPRAERPEFVTKLEKEVPHYRIRHMIKPGFTGWAQIKFLYARSVMDSYEKFQYDLYYIKNRNLIMDLAILVRTAYIIIKH